MAQKAPINQIQQQRGLDMGRANVQMKAAVNPWSVAIAKTSAVLSDELGKQAEQIRNLKMQKFESDMDIRYKEMNNALSQAQTEEEFDSIVKTTMADMKKSGQEYLGKGLYNAWENETGGNYYKALQLDADKQKIAFNQKYAFNTAKETVQTKAYNWAYAPNKEVQNSEDEMLNAYLASSGLNAIQVEALKKDFNHDKEYGYLTRMVTEDPKQVSKVLEDPNNFNHLSVPERESFKKQAVTSEKALKEAKQKQFEDSISEEYANARIQNFRGYDQKELKFKNLKAAGDDIPIFDVMSVMSQINRDSKIPFATNNGASLYLLDKIKGETYAKYKAFDPYLWYSISNYLNDGGNDKTVYGWGLNKVLNLINKNNLSERDADDILTYYHNAITGQFKDNPDALHRNIGFGQNELVLRAVNKAWDQARGNGMTNLDSVPADIPLRVVGKGSKEETNGFSLKRNMVEAQHGL